MEWMRRWEGRRARPAEGPVDGAVCSGRATEAVPGMRCVEADVRGSRRSLGVREGPLGGGESELHSRMPRRPVCHPQEPPEVRAVLWVRQKQPGFSHREAPDKPDEGTSYEVTGQ